MNWPAGAGAGTGTVAVAVVEAVFEAVIEAGAVAVTGAVAVAVVVVGPDAGAASVDCLVPGGPVGRAGSRIVSVWGAQVHFASELL